MSLTLPAKTARDRAGRGQGVKSTHALSLARDLLDAPVPVRREVIQQLSPAELAVVLQETQRETGSLYGQWHDTPSGFVEDVLGETQWGLQMKVTDSIALPGVTRVIVPAGFGVGKTFLAGRMVAWAGAVNPVGTIKIVTTATRMRQVKSQLWPHIKTAVAKGGLPGRTDTVQWVAPDIYGDKVQIAYGFSASPNDEAAMQGIHGTPKLLLVVDEAGGIAPLIGKGTNNLLTGDAKMLAIGNPAMDDPGSWFELMSAEGFDPDEPSTVAVKIAALDSPAITGEETPICRACVPNFDGHTISGGVPPHLPSLTWLVRTMREYGLPATQDMSPAELEAMCRDQGTHPYITAKVLAEFPKDAGAKTIPPTWVELATKSEDPEGDDYVRPADLGLPTEHDRFTIKKGAWVRLGIDVAADGGDEFAIYRSVGDVVHQRHVSSGAVNANSVVVAKKALAEIQAAETLAKAIGSTAQVRVKIDTIGLGWGVVGMLAEWGKEGKHGAKIVPVNVAEKPHADDESAEMRPFIKRDELWLTGRALMQPSMSTNEGRIRLRVDSRCAAQLTIPNYSTKGGFTAVETKKSMKKRGQTSPDRAEAALLAIYEPEPVRTKPRRGLLSSRWENEDATQTV